MSGIQHAALSDPGRWHRENEDRWLADVAAGLYLVSDGMANDVAPQMVVEQLPALLAEAGITRHAVASPAVPAKLAEVLTDLSGRIHEEADDLGTTLVLVLAGEAQALLAHVGDSRAYRHRGGALEQLTRDHSRLQELIDRGLLTAEAARSRWNGGPTRYLGMAARVEPDVQVLPLQAGDELLLCSDGLTEMLDDEEILAVLERPGDPTEVCRRLIDAANAAGGGDNITALLLRVEPGERGV
jgi:protein phosphatase